MICKGPTFDDTLIKKYVHGKKWIVFIHGGEFAWNNNIGAGYAVLSAEVARNSGMGVLAVDYRTSQNGQNAYRASKRLASQAQQSDFVGLPTVVYPAHPGLVSLVSPC